MNFAFTSTLNRSERPAWMEFLYAVFIRRPRYFRAFERIHRKRESRHRARAEPGTAVP
jgi:hypothetical protein